MHPRLTLVLAVLSLASCSHDRACSSECTSGASIFLDPLAAGSTVTVCKNAICAMGTASLVSGAVALSQLTGELRVDVYQATVDREYVTLFVEGSPYVANADMQFVDGDMYSVKVVDMSGATVVDHSEAATYSAVPTSEGSCGSGCLIATIDARGMTPG